MIIKNLSSPKKENNMFVQYEQASLQFFRLLMFVALLQ